MVSTRSCFQFALRLIFYIESKNLSLNTIYIDKVCYTPMSNSKNKSQNVSVGTDEGPIPKVALGEGGSRENIDR